jgi:hypothetical protein
VSTRSRVVWEGLEELKAALQALPDTCAGEAANLMAGTVNGAYVAIKSAYPSRTGKLRNGMKLLPVTRKGLVVGQKITNTAKHAQAFEHGSQARHTTIGANRGSMPPGHIFVPRIEQARRRLTGQLVELLKRHGATVSSDV